MFRWISRRLKRPKIKEVRIFIDSENLSYALKEIKKGHVGMLEVIDSSRSLLENNEQIKDIYFYDTYREGDLDQKSLIKELKKITNIKTVIKREKAIISGMTRKSRIDPIIICDIMEIKPDAYSKIIFFSGDSDFEEPIRRIKKQGIKSVVISSRGHLSKELKSVADRVVYLEDLKIS